MLKVISYLFAAFLFVGCVSKKRILYFQGIDSQPTYTNPFDYESPIQPDDILQIRVSTLDIASSNVFNQMGVNIAGTSGAANPATGGSGSGYLVDKNGFIQFPVLGKIMVVGKKRSELIDYLTSELKKYLKDPVVNVTRTNFKITILGEVNGRGTYNIPSERITLPEAIGMAGDISINGKRDNILIIREKNGVRTHARINLLSKDILQSEYFYLQNNDIVYVEPNRAVINSASAARSDINFFLGITTTLITVYLLFSR